MALGIGAEVAIIGVGNDSVRVGGFSITEIPGGRLGAWDPTALCASRQVWGPWMIADCTARLMAKNM